MQDTSYSLGPLLAGIRAELRGLRAARVARRTLRRELSGATTPNDFLELDAMIERYHEDETADLRHVLNERRAAWQLQSASAFPGRSISGE